MWYDGTVRVIVEWVEFRKSARARVVFADPEQAFHFGIALHAPENIWGISPPPEDWETQEDRR